MPIYHERKVLFVYFKKILLQIDTRSILFEKNTISPCAAHLCSGFRPWLRPIPRTPGVTKSRLTPLSHGLTKPYLHPNKLLLLPRRCRCRGLSSAARGQGGRERVGTPILNFSHDDAYRAPCLLCRNRTRRRRPVPTQDAPCSLCRSDDRGPRRAASTPVVTEDLQSSAPLYGH
jgi:hypothetical protein